ncbi:predicted protein [Uncinocarpus reesii 1704]|uniref:Uncharacterized protein n=1 Tax=Uncinocarpus reesii (strain UAMH 1704) TaxID=336963 RepID=C4JKH4_UNCRE|nr:uncharacterized protein UREG_02131 [Uncinocarpus reesii 1704]EEP77282.1 predicted protein [Uncinocarpus reesii 1704]
MASPASTPSSTAGRSSKVSKKSKTVTLKLSSALLKRFPGIAVASVDHEANAKVSASPSASSSSSTSTPVLPPTASGDNASEPRSTPPAGDATPADASKKKVGKTVAQRATEELLALEPLAATNSGRKPTKELSTAGLRALDRTGKPCRKWERKSFQLKSFTGVIWQLPSWRAPLRSNQADTTSDAKKSLALAEDNSTKNKGNQASSAMASEQSNSGDHNTPSFPGNTESSPAPVTAAA